MGELLLNGGFIKGKKNSLGGLLTICSMLIFRKT